MNDLQLGIATMMISTAILIELAQALHEPPMPLAPTSNVAYFLVVKFRLTYKLNVIELTE